MIKTNIIKLKRVMIVGGISQKWIFMEQGLQKLADNVAACPKFVRRIDKRGIIQNLPAAGFRKETIKLCPVRYVLDNESSNQCIEILLEQGYLLSPLDEVLRLPTSLLWVEFTANRPVSQDDGVTIGLLIEADENCRKGLVTLFFRNPAGDAEISPANIRFDLDQELILMPGSDRTFSIKHSNVKGVEQILKHCMLEFDTVWANFYRAKNRSDYNTRIRVAAEATWYVFPFVMALSILLNIKGLMEERPADLKEANTTRRKRGRTPLLDHIEVRMRLGSNYTQNDQNITSKGDRSTPRLHLVRGHVVRRGDKMFWRVSHFRENVTQSINKKTILVRALKDRYKENN